MAAMTQPDVLTVLAETRNCLHQTTDIDKINNIKNISRNVKKTVEDQQETVKNIVRELSNTVMTKKNALKQDISATEYQQKLSEIEAEQNELAQLIKTREADKSELRDRISKLQLQFEELKQQRASIVHDDTVHLPRERWVLSLYLNITNIKWDYDAPNVKGFLVPNGDETCPKPFSYDQSKMTEYDIINKLWDTMG